MLFHQTILFRWLTNNFVFKLMSLGLAIFLWYLAKQEAQTKEMSFYVPVVFTNLSDNLQVTSETPSLNVLARTTRRGGRDFNPSEVQAQLDLSNVQPGKFPYTLTNDNIISPEHVSIIRISPPQINLTIEEVIEKTLPIVPKSSGSIRKGYVLKEIVMEPDVVAVRAPKSILSELESIETRELDIEGLNRSVDKIVRLNFPHAGLQLVNPDRDYYTAHVKVSSLPGKKLFENIPVFLRNASYETRTNPLSFNLHLEGPMDILDDLKPSQLYGIIDLVDYRPGNYQVDPTPIFPSTEIKVLKQWPYISVWVKPQRLSNEERPAPSLENTP